MDNVWDFVFHGNLPEGDLSVFIIDAFETYEKWKAEREIHLQAIRRAFNLRAIRKACQQYEQWRQSYWRRRRGAEGPPDGPIYDP